MATERGPFTFIGRPKVEECDNCHQMHFWGTVSVKRQLNFTKGVSVTGITSLVVPDCPVSDDTIQLQRGIFARLFFVSAGAGLHRVRLP